MSNFRKSWTREEDAELILQHSQGFEYREIAKNMNRSFGSLCSRVFILGLSKSSSSPSKDLEISHTNGIISRPEPGIIVHRKI